jgi:hypothetical protein
VDQGGCAVPSVHQQMVCKEKELDLEMLKIVILVRSNIPCALMFRLVTRLKPFDACT